MATYSIIMTMCTKGNCFRFLLGLALISCALVYNFYSNTMVGYKTTQFKDPKYKLEHSLFQGTFDVHFSLATEEEFWDAGPIDIYEAFAQHSYKTLETCNNTCHVIEPVCKANSSKDLIKLNLQGLIYQKPFLARGQYVFEWEKKYLSHPPLNDIKTLPDLKLSKVTVENTRQGVVRCKILETIHGRLDVVDGYGRQRTKGDDVVRVWMKGGNNSDYAVVGNVTDLQNGSYTFAVKCLWNGTSLIKVAISYPREFMRVVIHQIQVGVARYMSGTFIKENLKEDTVCFHTPNRPGSECICNFSNFGYENYYCGRPRHPKLTCDDWLYGDTLKEAPAHDVTAAEKYLLATIRGTPEQRSVSHGIKVLTISTGKLPEMKPCRESNKNVTWVTNTTKGFWTFGNIWNSLICKDQGAITRDLTRNCLRNTSVWIFGDSNGRLAYFSFTDIVQCVKKEGAYPDRASCVIPEYNINITLLAHEPPKYVWTRRSDNFTGVPDFIQTLPRNKKHVLIIHYYLHYTAAHLSVLSLRMRKLRDAIEKMLETNPNVLVGLRIPHVTSKYYKNHAVGGDPLGPQYIELIRERFRGLEDKVVFLDLWEMSIGIENVDYHPPQYINREMIKFLLSFQC
ncbi:NXPE family member 4-like [Physella acuta]|uniref:NXPE family member 4-like n=1 Tax=Physella acuta TaxID=109671 RepID=UPI0027DBB878|nr:NXPE family member 4-like [Physella acuta]